MWRCNLLRANATISRLAGRQSGITGLETAIVLIAFVVVSSVFAFAALSTGLFSSDKAKDTIQSGLAQARGTLEPRGGLKANAVIVTKSLSTVTAEAVGTGDGAVTLFTFANSPVLTNSETVYLDAVAKTRVTDYTINFSTGAVTFVAAPGGGVAVTADYQHGNEAVGTGDGAALTFTLANKPVISGSVSVYADGTAEVMGTDFDVNYVTGVITFTVAPANNIRIDATYKSYTVNTIKFTLANAAGGQPMDMTPGRTVMGYTDTDSIDTNITNFIITPLGNADTDNLLESGEMFEFSVDVSGFALAKTDEFSIEIKPDRGAVLTLARTIPATIATVMNLG